MPERMGALSPWLVLRLEGLATGGLSILLFDRLWLSRWWSALWIAPDVSIAAYVVGPRVGVAVYNRAHNIFVPSIMAAYGIVEGSSVVVAIALVWFLHIGADRLFGYGPKYRTGCRVGHLQRV